MRVGTLKVHLNQEKKKLLVGRETRQHESQHTSRLVVHHAGKVLDPKLCLVAVFGRDVVGVELVLGVKFIQHRGISSLETENQRKTSADGLSQPQKLEFPGNFLERLSGDQSDPL